MSPTESFFGSETLKYRLVEMIQWHRKQDMITQGTYGAELDDGNWQGCAVGCAIHSMALLDKQANPDGRPGRSFITDNHEMWPELMGLPIWLAHLADAIFEGLSKAEAMTFPERLIAAVPVGSNLELARHRFTMSVLNDVLTRVRKADIEPRLVHLCEARLLEVLGLHSRVIAGERVSQDEWQAVRRSADIAKRDILDAKGVPLDDIDMAYDVIRCAIAAADVDCTALGRAADMAAAVHEYPRECDDSCVDYSDMYSLISDLLIDALSKDTP